MNTRPLSVFDADIEALADCLRKTSVGTICSYTDLDEALGRTVQENRYLLVRARDRVEREDGAIFATVFKTGLKRLPVSEYVTVGQHARKGIRSKARGASKRMQNGIEKANDVPAEVVRAVSREQSVLGLIQFAARNSTMKKMLQDESITAPTPLAKAAKDLMAALGVKVDE